MNKLDSMLLQMKQFSEGEMQNLSGGFVEAALSKYSRAAAGNVNVDVSGHTYGCSCDNTTVIIGGPVR